MEENIDDHPQKRPKITHEHSKIEFSLICLNISIHILFKFV